MAKTQNQFLKKATGAGKAPAHVAAKRTHGLGRGLDSLIPTAAVPAVAAAPAVSTPAATAVTELKILEIERSPYQPRREFKPEELQELADSLKHSGLVHPPTVRRNSQGRWELVSGERRLRAAQLAGWTKIRVTVIEADDLTAAAMTTTENIQRYDLNPIEEALAYKTLQDDFGLTQADVAEKVGKGRATVANSVRLLELPDEVKSLLQAGHISVGHAKVLLSVEDEKERVLLARDCVNDQLTVRKLEQKVAKLHAPPPVKQPSVPDLPANYVKMLVDRMKKQLGCAVRLTSSSVTASGKRVKGVLEVDFFDNDDLDRVIRMLGVKVD